MKACFVEADVAVVVGVAEQEERNIVKVVYDDGYYTGYRKRIYDQDPTNNLLKDLLLRELAQRFRVDAVPEPIDMVYQYWPNAWHFQHRDAQHDIYEIEEWAQEPHAARRFHCE